MGDENLCGVCRADLWQVQDQSLETAVKEEEGLEGEKDEQLRKKELPRAQKLMMARLGVYVATAVFIVYGFWLMLYSKPARLVSLTPFSLGVWLVYVGFGMVLFLVIGAPRARRAGVGGAGLARDDIRTRVSDNQEHQIISFGAGRIRIHEDLAIVSEIECLLSSEGMVSLASVIPIGSS